MCGIAGQLNFRSGAPVDRQVVQGMCDLLAHRGPDGEGVYACGHVGLGHRRLAIIDLSPAGRQPMASEDERFRITFNGEVYNFLDLRADLEARGHRFRSRTDTEVVLAAYREFGVGCLDRLRGMFAFAIYDASDRSLFLARDRLGTKPLVYWLHRDGISFASEPKAFLADPAFEITPDAEALFHYVSYQYVPAPLSAFVGVRKLPPAHYLLVKDSHTTLERYWKLRYGDKRAMSEDEACEELVARLREAVRLRLISDVPLGAFLSGGLDSGAVVALMALESGARVKTFSIGFDEKEYDERPFARLVAERYGTEHHEFVVRPQALDILPKLVWHYNEPYADSSAIPTYYLAERTRQHVTVALNGDAGDENFAGYDRYRANVLAAPWDRIPAGLRRAVARRARALLSGGRTNTTLQRAGRFLEAIAEPPERRYGRWMMHVDGALKDALCTREFAQAAGAPDSLTRLTDWYARSDARDFVDATLDVDVNMYLPDDLLVKVDIATMAHGLEARSPLLDHKVMEFAASLPSSMKLRGRTRKYIFKRAVKALLPGAILTRRKMGFGVPLDRWFRGELRELAADVLLGRRLRERGYFRPEFLERIVSEHVGGVRNWHDQLWNLLMFELWHRMFVDERPTARHVPGRTPADG